jgi:signal peptidase I
MIKAKYRIYQEYGMAIVIAVSVALLIRLFVVEAYRIPNVAMRPTVEPGDTIFVNKLSAATRRGDVIIFSPVSDPNHDYIKRVIGLGGDTVEIRGTQLWLNGQKITAEPEIGGHNCGHESFPEGRQHEVCWEPPAIEDFGPEVVPQSSLFVLGDLRTQASKDITKPKSWGMIPKASVKGKAMMIWLSLDPQASGRSGLFPQFRFERMFRRIE